MRKLFLITWLVAICWLAVPAYGSPDGGVNLVSTSSSSSIEGICAPSNKSLDTDYWELLSKIANILEAVGFLMGIYIALKTRKIDQVYTKQLLIPRLSKKLVGNTKNLEQFIASKSPHDIQKECQIIKANITSLKQHSHKVKHLKIQIDGIFVDIKTIETADALMLLLNTRKLLADLLGLLQAVDNVRSEWSAARERQ